MGNCGRFRSRCTPFGKMSIGGLRLRIAILGTGAIGGVSQDVYLTPMLNSFVFLEDGLLEIYWRG